MLQLCDIILIADNQLQDNCNLQDGCQRLEAKQHGMVRSIINTTVVIHNMLQLLRHDVLHHACMLHAF